MGVTANDEGEEWRGPVRGVSASDDDDVRGHGISAVEDDDDVAGHGVTFSQDDVSGHGVSAADDDDDVQGHGVS